MGQFDFGKKYIILEDELKKHVKGKNPHGTTKSDIGLGNVENVAPKDMDLSENASITNLQEQIDSLNVVVNIVKTYNPDLINYPTENLKDGALFKVLKTNDPEHSEYDDQITFYKWNASTELWEFQGPDSASQEQVEELKQRVDEAENDINALQEGKQDTISDLSDIRANAELGATAVQPEDLALVATTGSYIDLEDKPFIGEGNLTIKQNNEVIGTFNANDNENQTVNIVVPTKTSDLTNDSGFLSSVNWSQVAGKPSKLSEFTNDSGFINKEVNNLTNYPTKAELEGNYTPTRDIYTKTQADEKLAEKQDVIIDLNTIRAGAAKGATAVQPRNLAAVATTGDYDDLLGKPVFATINGQDITQVSEINIPQGPVGPQGPQGPAGATGATGPQGPAGTPGAKGDEGNGIVSITKTATAGKTDTYTVTYTNGTTDTITVTNGRDGATGPEGPKGEAGATGQNGITPHIDATTGNWFIGNIDTGVHAQGDTGIQGPQGIQGIQGPTGATGATGPTGQKGADGAQGPQGEKGDKGDKGDTGTSITSVIEWYIAFNSDNASDLPSVGTGTWKNITAGDPMPEINATLPYLWNAEVITYSDTTSTSIPPALIGKWGKDGEKGDTGDTGATGDDGRGIDRVVDYYAVNDDKTQVPQSGWGTRPVSVSSSNRYLWNYEEIWYDDGSHSGSIADAIVIGAYGDTGAQGPQGIQGEQGVQGPAGQDGADGQDATQYYIHYVYVDDLTTGAGYSTTTTAKYVGVYVDTVLTDASTYSEAAGKSGIIWSQIEGEQGIQGIQGPVGPAGQDGEDGKSIDVKDSWSSCSTAGEGFIDSRGHLMFAAVNNPRDPSLYPTDWTDAGEIKGPKGDTGATGDTGPQGPAGADGVSITSVYEFYLKTTASSGVNWDTQGWQNVTTGDPMPIIDSTNMYLWNYEQINYSVGQPTKTQPTLVGKWSQDGATGATGNGISSVVDYYKTNNDDEHAPDNPSTWPTTPQSVTSSNKYLWNYEKITYTDGTVITSTPCVIGAYGEQGEQGPKGDTGATGAKGETGAQGPKGDQGDSITSIHELYLATNQSSGVTRTTPGWVDVSQGLTIPQVDSTHQYLWNYEQIYKTGNVLLIQTDPTIIGKWASDGQNGQNGDDGRGISSIVEWYALNNDATTYPPIGGSAWSNNPQSVTAENRYLWNYEVINYTDSTSDISTPIVIGAFGEQGQQGIQGIQGETGPQGPTGATGATGEKGEKGDKGDTGETGATGPQGPSGDDGVSVTSITKTSTTGLVDTYQITYSNGTTSSYTVTNGAKGETGETGPQGIQGVPGSDGHTPVITVDETTGNWLVDGVDTGIHAQGPQGETGPEGPQGPAGEDGDDGVTIVSDVIEYAGTLTLSTIGAVWGTVMIQLTDENKDTVNYVWQRETITYSRAVSGSTTKTIAAHVISARGKDGQPGSDADVNFANCCAALGITDATVTSGIYKDLTDPNNPKLAINANAIVTDYLGAHQITANQIDATNLHVAAANIDNQLTASQINTTGLEAEKVIVKDASNNVLFKADGTSNPHAVSIANFTVENGKIYNGKSTIDSSTNGVYIGTDGIAVGNNFKVTSGGVVTLNNYVKGAQNKYRQIPYDNETEAASHYADWTTWTSTNWTSTIPTRIDGQFIWEWTKEELGDNTLRDKGRVCITGATGETGPQGDPGQDGADGDDGVSIVSVIKTGTSGLIDTYTITYSNGTTSTYTVTNGEDGQDGQNGVSVQSITKTGTSGLTDTYTITYSNGTTSTYTVTNGQDGDDGADGLTPFIGNNGNWWIGSTDLGVKAQGPAGQNGQDGATGRSVLSVVKYYKLSNTAPSAPTTKNPSDWSTTIPSWTSGKDYYESERTLYDTAVSGVDYSWSTPVKNSMLTVDFINSLGITAKRIEVKDSSNNTIFLADSSTKDVQIAAANVTGQLAASQINTSGLQAESILVQDSSSNTIFSANSSTKTVSVGGFTVKDGEISYSKPNGDIPLLAPTVKISTSGISLGPKALPTFSVNAQGELTAQAGKIAGFTISAPLIAGNPANLSYVNSSDNTKRVYLGTDKIELGSASSPKFKVTDKGILTATDANLSGTVTANSGAIAGFNIGNDNTNSWILSGTKQANNSVYVGTDGIYLGQNFGVDKTGRVLAEDTRLFGDLQAEHLRLGDITLKSVNKSLVDYSQTESYSFKVGDVLITQSGTTVSVTGAAWKEDLEGHTVSGDNEKIKVTAHIVHNVSGFGVSYYKTNDVTQEVTLSGDYVNFTITYSLAQSHDYLKKDLCWVSWTPTQKSAWWGDIQNEQGNFLDQYGCVTQTFTIDLSKCEPTSQYSFALFDEHTKGASEFYYQVIRFNVSHYLYEKFDRVYGFSVDVINRDTEQSFETLNGINADTKTNKVKKAYIGQPFYNDDIGTYFIPSESGWSSSTPAVGVYIGRASTRYDGIDYGVETDFGLDYRYNPYTSQLRAIVLTVYGKPAVRNSISEPIHPTVG